MNPQSGWEQELRERLDQIFTVEAAERLAALDAAVVALEGGATGDAAADHLGDAFRHAHTLKGGARATERPDVERISHALESLFDGLRSGEPAGPDTWATVAAAVEALRALVAGRPAGVDTVVADLTALSAEAD